MTSLWLLRALEESRARGFLGPKSVEFQIEHARGFIDAWVNFRPEAPHNVLDLGSGGGVPGLILLDHWQQRTVLLDSMERRTKFIGEVLAWPDVPSVGEVWRGRAEDLARERRGDSQFDLVTSRSFGSPAATAECAARLLNIGGLLIVSEPPQSRERWSVAGLGLLGLEVYGTVRDRAGFQVIRKVSATPPTYPRSSGIPKKHPLF